MKKLSKITATIITIILGFCLITNVSFAANLYVDVKCDGKTIQMTSKTPEMTWTINNILPGETEETTLKISNTGKKEVNVEFIATIEQGKEVADVLEIKIINISDNLQGKSEQIYNGKYTDLTNVNTYLDKNDSQEFKIITTLPENVGNEFQEKECIVKFNFVARGMQDEEPKSEPKDEPAETPAKEIITTEVKTPQTGESYAIFIIMGILAIAIIILCITFVISKKRDNENNK